jgi:hypothetical protein
MNTNKKAILIDAKTNSVTLVEVGEYTDIYKHCGYETFTCVGLGNGETLYVDDEGLINGTDFGFTIEGYDGPLMGNGLILGSTASGDSKDTALSVHEVAEKVRCLRKVSRMLIRSADPANVR